MVAARDIAGSWRARRLHEGAAPGSVPVAVLTPDAAERLGASTRVVVYSPEQAEKMRDRPARRTVELGALEGLHAAMSGGDVIVERDERSGLPRLVAIGAVDGALWRYVVKRTERGDELFLLSWYRQKPRRLRRLRARIASEE